MCVENDKAFPFVTKDENTADKLSTQIHTHQQVYASSDMMEKERIGSKAMKNKIKDQFTMFV